MQRGLVFLFLTIGAISTKAIAQVSVASVDYVSQTVETSVATKVDTSASANQTMAGSYTVSGSFKVPTPPLPPAP